MHQLRILHWAGAALVLLLCSPVQAQEQAYRLRGNQLVVDQRSHWMAWKVAGGIAEITPDSRVAPRFTRKNINAALNAERFANSTSTGGIKAGSNPLQARNLIDADGRTFWGPDPDSPLKDWRFTLHLGRIVIASKIVLRFVAEDLGDPFLQFKVLAWRQGPKRAWSDRQYTLPGTSTPNFWEIGRTERPNKDQRVFEFSLDPSQATDDAFEGDPIEAVRVIVTDSDFDRAAEVPQEVYEALPAEKQGAVDYYRKDASGQEALISKEDYEAIAAAHRGPICHYRKEIPRLAEIEVWTPGENLNFGAPERGGFLTVDTNAGPKNLGHSVTDGDYTTGHDASAFSGHTYTFFEDMGALFWIDTMQFILDGASPIDEFFVDISDGTLAPDGTIKWTRVATSLFRAKFREIRIDPFKVRYIRTPFQNPERSLTFIGFTEVMLYGQGYVPEVVLSSDLIRLGGTKNLISINWEADAPPGTAVRMQTRTGNQLDELKVFHDSNGNVITEKESNRLPKFKKGETTSLFVPGGDWSPWTPPYRRSGELIQSPSPREFMEIRAQILTERPDAAASLRSITVDLSDPLADRLLGEVWPNQTETTGQTEDFSFFLRPSFSSFRQGFDELAITTTAGVKIEELLEVRLGSDEDFRSGETTPFSPAELAAYRTLADTLWLRLPAPVGQAVDMLEIRFRSTFFANSASFNASVQSSRASGFWQRVDAGQATDLVDSQTTTVLALGGNEILKDVHIDPGIMTPNQDGVNDEMTFNFSVSRLTLSDAVSVTIYDLSGAVVKKLSERRIEPRGRYAMVWSGKDASLQLVPPGIYLARIQVEARGNEAAATSAERLIYVAY